jgi:hypothetical protein
LDIQLWPKDGDISFGDGAVSDLLNLFKNRLDKNGCDVDKIVTEWDTLKTFVQPLVSSNKEITYLEVWKRVLTNNSIKAECQNILHLIEILLIIPFRNAKVERMFSRMNRVKSDWRNGLNRDTLDDYEYIIQTINILYSYTMHAFKRTFLLENSSNFYI